MKTALITGATSGLGEAIAEYYHNNDYQVIGISRTSKEIRCNLADPASLAEICFDKFNGFDKVDVLVNNAGRLSLPERLHDAHYLYNLLIYAPYILMTRLEKELIGGHIINIASVSGMKADPDTPMYGALKAGVISLTKSFARKLAPHTRVNCISPGFFNTNLVPGPAPKELLKDDRVLLNREADPSEIIPVVKMLDESDYITGANIVIDGGITI
jgi:NAD(P)-dependent dehydrogenase (short-subunit alcohol dehydrogenase family)